MEMSTQAPKPGPGDENSPQTAEICGRQLAYCMCRVLPDTALVLRDVMVEAERLWTLHLGPEAYAGLVGTPEGAEFFTARVRLEAVPPARKMVAVWLPFPADFRARIKPQLIDYVEATATIPKLSSRPSTS